MHNDTIFIQLEAKVMRAAPCGPHLAYTELAIWSNPDRHTIQLKLTETAASAYSRAVAFYFLQLTSELCDADANICAEKIGYHFDFRR